MNTQQNAPGEQTQPTSVLGSSISRRQVMIGVVLTTIIPTVSAKERSQVINIDNSSVTHRINTIDNILRLKSSKSQERDADGNLVLRIKMQTQEYVFAIGKNTITLSRLSGGYNDKTQKREVRKLDFSYRLSTLGDTWALQTYKDTDNLTIMQHIGDIEGVLSKEFI